MAEELVDTAVEKVDAFALVVDAEEARGAVHGHQPDALLLLVVVDEEVNPRRHLARAIAEVPAHLIVRVDEALEGPQLRVAGGRVQGLRPAGYR